MGIGGGAKNIKSLLGKKAKRRGFPLPGLDTGIESREIGLNIHKNDIAFSENNLSKGASSSILFYEEYDVKFEFSPSYYGWGIGIPTQKMPLI
jgi:hypothetical protein